MTSGLTELRKRAAQQLTGAEAEVKAFEETFREKDPKNAELLERVRTLSEEVDPRPDSWNYPDPDGIAMHACFSDHDQLRRLGEELIERLSEFREETGFRYPDELTENFLTTDKENQ